MCLRRAAGVYLPVALAYTHNAHEKFTFLWIGGEGDGESEGGGAAKW
jgi:hypothetical protein